MWFYKVVSTLLICSLALSCTDKNKAIATKADQEPYSGPALESKDLHVIKTDSAKLDMTLDAKTQIILTNDDQEYPEGIFVTFYEGKEVVKSTIKSNYAYYDDKNDKWKLSGDVKVINNQKGQNMDTELMFWNPSAKDSTNIFVPDSIPVFIKEPDQELEGLGLRATDDFLYYHMDHVVGQKWID